MKTLLAKLKDFLMLFKTFLKTPYHRLLIVETFNKEESPLSRKKQGELILNKKLSFFFFADLHSIFSTMLIPFTMIQVNVLIMLPDRIKYQNTTLKFANLKSFRKILMYFHKSILECHSIF